MQISVSGKQVDLGDALQRYVTEQLTAAVSKYFDDPIEAQVVFRREAHMFHADCSVHIGSGITMKAAAEASDIYASFDLALQRLEKQVRRDKRRRRDHHAAQRRMKNLGKTQES